VAHPQIAAFARLANGNARPVRSIAGQHTMFTRTIHDFSYNQLRDELVVPQLYSQAIMTYRGDSDGDVSPLRVIRGPHTQITGVFMRLSLDPVHEEVFVPLGNEILVFPSLAEGDVPPIRVIKGPDTQLGASALSIDAVHDLLVVAGGYTEGTHRNGQILIFDRKAEGNAKPLRVIKGPKTMLSDRDSGDMLVTVYPPKELIVMGAPGVIRNDPTSFVGVWSQHDDGDAAPRFTIGGPNGVLKQTRGVALDPRHKSIVVGDKYVNAVMTFYFPEIF